MDAISTPESPPAGRVSGSSSRVCDDCAGLSDIREQCNHAQKTAGKPCVGRPQARFERGTRSRARKGTAPLTTNGHREGASGASATAMW
jgi:hypothetical protein